ncbi:BglG family transcription antiterminator [Shouchella shacheensis]|uniref:BglG family transcription antiterminator n=1 Tax=Shouchella shacheensis TaxID=1649580 RepID=UPI00073FB622|nr:BglG family transcription antiterminator [Shouchella shacheensis]
MALNDRSQRILNELVSNPSINSATLEKKYNITRRQLGYSIWQINEWLKQEKVPEIERTRQGHFVVHRSILEKVSREALPSEPDTTMFLTEEQRVQLIVMMLLSSKEELSLQHFHSALGYSKNTILNDLKHVQYYLDDYGLSVRYSRKSGYLLEGKEFQVRKLLIDLTGFILRTKTGKWKLEDVANVKQSEVDEFNQRIENVEIKLGIKFTDEKLLTMPYVFILVLRRIENENILDPFSIEYDELSDTKEYQATEEIFRNVKHVPMQERMFVALHLLAANIHWSEIMDEDNVIPNLVPAISTMLRLFEQSACIYFHDRELLMKKLVQHIKPAYYRIKYQLTEMDVVKNSVSTEYKELLHLVKRCLGPLEELLGKKIPENEVTYITMLIGAWMTRQGESIEKKVKAIVVCPQGVSVSRLMFKELSELFPEFVFLDSLSVREFKTYELAYDIVFSQTPLEADKKLYVTKAFLGKEERYRLKKQVMLDVHGYNPNEINVDHVLDIIKNHASIPNEKALLKDLQRYFFSNKETKQAEEKDKVINLNELIQPPYISMEHATSSWEEAIRISAEPLVKKGKIEERYVEALVNNRDRDPYIVIGPHLAIPHAAPEEGVQKVGMSLLRLREPVAFSEEEEIHVIVVIAAVDKHQHIRGLRQLLRLSASEEDRNRLIEANTVAEITDIIDTYSLE